MEVIDVHTHFGKWALPTNCENISIFLEIMRRNRIAKSIVSSSLAILYDFQEGNKELRKIIDSYNKKLYGYVVVNPNYFELSKRELKFYLGFKNFVGVKFHPKHCQQSICSYESRKLLKVIEDYQVPLLLHTYSSSLETPRNLLKITQDFSNLKIILAHMGGDNWKAGIEVAQKVKNTYLEICCSHPARDKIREAVDRIGARRVLFGSDSTLLDPAFALGMVKDADISQKEKELILYRNAQQLFDLK